MVPSRPWHGGRLFQPGNEALPAGYRTGDGVFETIRTYGGRPFRLRAHVNRLLEGGKAIGLSALPQPGRVEQEILAVLAGSKKGNPRATEWILRPALFSDGKGWGFLPATESWFPPAEPTRDRSLVVGTSRYPHPGPYLMPPSSQTPVKWLSRGPLSHALRDARGQGWDEALLCDGRGHFIEGTRSNLFMVVGSDLITPGSNSGALPGITRAAVVECATEKGLKVQDRPIPPSLLLRAEEVFLTSTLLGLSPVATVDGNRIGGGRSPGKITRLLREDFDALVEREIQGEP